MFQTPTLSESELDLTFTMTCHGRCHLGPFYPSAQFDKKPPGQRMLVLRVDPEHRSGKASKETGSISNVYLKEYFDFFFWPGLEDWIENTEETSREERREERD